MTHRIGLKLWSTNTNEYLHEAVRLFHAGVYDYVEVYFVPGTLETAAKWKSLALPYVIHAPHSHHGLNLADVSKKIFNLSVYNDVKRFADFLGASDIIQHGGVFGAIDEAIRQILLIDDPRLILENKPWFPIDRGTFRLVGSTPKEIELLLRETGNRFCLDIGHMISSANAHHVDWIDYFWEFQKCAPCIYHLSDMDIASEIDQHFHFGQGNLPIREILSKMIDKTPISIETVKNSKTTLNDFYDDVCFLKREII